MTEHDVFISHSSNDTETTDKVRQTLEARGITCWIAPRDIEAGADWGEAIVSGIERSRLFLLIFSERANQSQHVMREVERAVNRGLYIIPFRIDAVVPSRSMEDFVVKNEVILITRKSTKEALGTDFIPSPEDKIIGKRPVALMETLDHIVSVDYENAQFPAVLADLRSSYNLISSIDKNSGVALEKPEDLLVTLRVNELPLRSVLRLLCDQVEARYEIRNGEVFVFDARHLESTALRRMKLKEAAYSKQMKLLEELTKKRKK